MTAAPPESRLALAAQLIAEAKVYEAIAELEALVTEHPSFLQGYIQLGLLHFRIGAIAKGREFMNRALAVAPSPEEKAKIQTVLREQDKLDKNRYYRPDFAALRKQSSS